MGFIQTLTMCHSSLEHLFSTQILRLGTRNDCRLSDVHIVPSAQVQAAFHQTVFHFRDGKQILFEPRRLIPVTSHRVILSPSCAPYLQLHTPSTMHSLSFFLPSFLLLLTSTWLLPTLAAPPMGGPPTTSSLRMASNDFTDPYYQPPLPGSSISLMLSGFLKPYHLFEPLMLMDIAAKAQFEIVKGVVDSRGDAVIAQPNFQWCSNHGKKPVCLRLNHTLQSAFRCVIREWGVM